MIVITQSPCLYCPDQVLCTRGQGKDGDCVRRAGGRPRGQAPSRRDGGGNGAPGERGAEAGQGGVAAARRAAEGGGHGERRGYRGGLPHPERLPGEEDVPRAAGDHGAREGRQDGEGTLEKLPSQANL